MLAKQVEAERSQCRMNGLVQSIRVPWAAFDALAQITAFDQELEKRATRKGLQCVERDSNGAHPAGLDQHAPGQEWEVSIVRLRLETGPFGLEVGLDELLDGDVNLGTNPRLQILGRIFAGYGVRANSKRAPEDSLWL